MVHYSKQKGKAFLLLLIGLIFTSFTGYFTYLDIESQTEKEFLLVSNEIKTKIVTRLHAHAQLLRSGAAYFNVVDTVTRNDWKEFIKQSKIELNLPGIQGVGFSLIIPKSELPQHIQKVRDEGFPEYTVNPVTDREDYTSIIYLEPFNHRNKRAFGYDMFSQKIRREAMKKSRDFDIAALTGKVLLVQETNTNLQAGALMYVPVYRSDKEVNTIIQRREAIIGWVYSPYRMDDLMQGILGSWNNKKQKAINLRIYDGNSTNENDILFKSIQNHEDNLVAKYVSLKLDFNGKIWTLYFTEENKNLVFYSNRTFIILFSGTLISLFFLSFSLFNSKHRAKVIAKKLTSNLSFKNKELILLNKQLLTAKEQAEENEEQLSRIANNFVDGMIYQVAMLDENKRKFNYVSDAVIKLYGCTPKQAIENSDLIYKKLHPDDVTDLINLEKEALKNMSVFKTECRVINPDGSIRWSYFVSQPRIINDLVCWDGIEIDITKKKQFEIELVRTKEVVELNENRLIDAQAVAKVGSWETNLLTMEVIWSEETYKIFEVDKDNFKNSHLSFLNYVHKNDIENVKSAFANSYSTKRYNSVQHRIITPSNKVKHIEERWRIIHDENNKPIKAFGTSQDITERKKVESELIKTKEKAEESDRLKSAFLANMSHEIRTPMNGIMGFSKLLKEPNLTGDKQQKYIDIISKSGDRMLNVINDIIDISKIESGQIQLSLSKIDVNEILDYINTFFKPEGNQKNIQLILLNKLQSDEAIILTDKEKVSAILTNLVKNAIKFTDQGTIVFGFEKKGTYLQGFVKDTGIGIPESRQKAIFERFIQADIEDKMAYQGAGLGLSISKSYVELLGGEIWVESKLGKGSSFHFTIPCETKFPIQETIIPPPTKEKIASKKKSLKILIVDDDESSEMLLTIAIEPFGKEILIARNGVEAVELCRNNPDIDLILMDILMPLMNGYEATQKIREFNNDVIIIAQTAYSLSGDKEKALEVGCNDYIAKPISIINLVALVQKYF